MKSRQDFATEKEWLDYYRHCAALAAMQGMLAYGWNVHEYNEAASHSVKAADALINALNAEVK